jgi:hypothetical protein
LLIFGISFHPKNKLEAASPGGDGGESIYKIEFKRIKSLKVI